jgi:hypothetical protein
MSKEDTDFIIKSWKELCDSLMGINESLRELATAQHQTILRLQGIQTTPPLNKSGTLTGEKEKT